MLASIGRRLRRNDHHCSGRSTRGGGFDWNLELLRFTNRVGIYVTDEQQSVRLDFGYPDARHNLNRWLPIVKWFLAIPHYIVLVFLYIGALFAVIAAWFAILFTGRYPRALLEYIEGVIRCTTGWSATPSSSSPTATRRSGCALSWPTAPIT